MLYQEGKRPKQALVTNLFFFFFQQHHHHQVHYLIISKVLKRAILKAVSQSYQSILQQQLIMRVFSLFHFICLSSQDLFSYYCQFEQSGSLWHLSIGEDILIPRGSQTLKILHKNRPILDKQLSVGHFKTSGLIGLLLRSSFDNALFIKNLLRSNEISKFKLV